LGEDYDKVVEYATKDKRLGNSHWSVPGPDGKKGFGGSCFPKDLNAFVKEAEKLQVDCHTLKGAWETNLHVRPEKDWEALKGRAVVD
jgi:UDPglucose 6-dehydrogenase